MHGKIHVEYNYELFRCNETREDSVNISTISDDPSHRRCRERERGLFSTSVRPVVLLLFVAQYDTAHRGETQVLLGCVCECVLVYDDVSCRVGLGGTLWAEGGFIESCRAQQPQGYQKAFHCSVVEVAVLCSKHFRMWCQEATN